MNTSAQSQPLVFSPLGGFVQEQSTDPSLVQLRVERLREAALFESQPAEIKLLLSRQAGILVRAILEERPGVRFRLPERILAPNAGNTGLLEVPAEFRNQSIGRFLLRTAPSHLRAAIRTRLSALEQSFYPGVSISARLIRFAMAAHLIHDLVPEGDTAPANAGDSDPGKTGAFLPRLAAFDHGRLTAASIGEAERMLRELQQHAAALHLAIAIAPCMFTDEGYQSKRLGVVGQLVSQGRALAFCHTERIIAAVGRRAAEGTLNRGLALSLPYFDDQNLTLRLRSFEVIPPGRFQFVPAFVVLAVRREMDKVELETSLSSSTRMHLLSELKSIEQAFGPARE